MKRRAVIAFVCTFVVLFALLSPQIFRSGIDHYVGANGTPHWYWEVLARLHLVIIIIGMSVLAGIIAAKAKPAPPVVEPLSFPPKERDPKADSSLRSE